MPLARAQSSSALLIRCGNHQVCFTELASGKTVNVAIESGMKSTAATKAPKKNKHHVSLRPEGDGAGRAGGVG